MQLGPRLGPCRLFSRTRCICVFGSHFSVLVEMSSSRLRDDVRAYRKALRQSVDPLSYQLDPSKYIHSQSCRPVLGILGGNNVSTVPNMVDAESTLWNITRPAAYDARPGQDQGLDLKRHLGACQFHQLKTMPGAVWDTPHDGSVASQWRSHPE